MKNLTLKNDFHNSEVTLRVKHIGEIAEGDIIEISAGQVKKAQNALCGIDECTCSGSLGIRADWHMLDDTEVKISYSTYQNQRNGRNDGAKLCIEQVF